ncbi:succinyl-CoA synthetase alpha subunit [Ceratobasidium sp. AG-Ba]|nr:succinyl-CoA synthetase alpha subunit [Ceratobasidium sp. AG-Ba]
MSVESLFFKSPKFAVILKWYLDRKIPVTPVHPKESELEGVKTVTSLDKLESPTTTSVSIVTPPKVTLSVLQAGKALGIPAFWLQPGAEDEAVREYVEQNGLKDKVVLGGPCVLVKGDGIRKSLL